MMASPLRSLVLGLSCLAFLSCVEPVDKGNADAAGGSGGSGGRGGGGGSGGGAGSGGSGGSGGGGGEKRDGGKAPDAAVKRDTGARMDGRAPDGGARDVAPRDTGMRMPDAAVKRDMGGGAARGYNLPPDLAAQFRGTCAPGEDCTPRVDLTKTTGKQPNGRRPAP
jgi:hypothetical protein